MADETQALPPLRVRPAGGGANIPPTDSTDQTDQATPSDVFDRIAKGIETGADVAGRVGKGALTQAKDQFLVDPSTLIQPHPYWPWSAEPFQQGVDAWNQGDKTSAVRHFVSGAIPLVGGNINQLGNQAGSGQLPEALGGAAVLGTTLGLGARTGAGEAPKPVVAPEARGFMPSPEETLTAEKTGATVKGQWKPGTLGGTTEEVLQPAAVAQAQMEMKSAFGKLNPQAQQLHLDNLIDESAQAVNAGDFGKATKLQGQYQTLSGMHDDVMAGINKAMRYEAVSPRPSLWGMAAKIVAPEAAQAYPHWAPGAQVVHAAGHVVMAARAANLLLRSNAGRAAFARLGSMTVGSPGFETMWNAMKAGAATGTTLSANPPQATSVLDQPQWQLPGAQARGGLITNRLPDRRAVLESLKGGS